MTYPKIYISTKSGLPNGYVVENPTILVVVQLSVGRYGNAETNQALTKKHIKSPCEILILACSFLTYWAGMYKEVTHEKILVCVQQLLVCSHKVLATHLGTSSTVRLLPSPSEEEQDEDDSNCKKRNEKMGCEAWKTVGRGLFVSFT